MIQQKQVNKEHYQFQRYMTFQRWSSLWHQLDEIIRLQPDRVLEIGPGPGTFSQSARNFGIHVETLDLDPELNPTHVASVTEMPFPDNSFDVVCAFQMLEHLPYQTSLNAFEEMCRVARGHVVISLPNAGKYMAFTAKFPRLKVLRHIVPLTYIAPKRHKFDGEHYWEVNKIGYSEKKIVNDFSKWGSLKRSFRVTENPVHHFFVFSPRDAK